MMANKISVGHQFSGVRLQTGRPARVVGQAYSLHHGRPVSDADYAPGRTRYENTGQLQLLRKSYQYGTPTNSPTLGNSKLSHTSTQEVDVQELTQQLKIPLYKQLIGNTAMVDLSSLSPNPQVKILGKCEFANPSGSIKDRIADHILTTAEQEGKLKPGGTVVAATSGNTGASVAMIAAMKGYHYIVITNEKTSKEKCDAMRSYGGEVIVAPSGVPADHPDHYQNMAVTLCKENADYFDVDQYDNPNNPEAYYRSLGPEIWMQTKSRVTHFVAGGSTGGTISGTGRFLKDMNPKIKVMLPDPVGSVFWDFWANRMAEKELKPKSYQCEGVGKDSIPGAIDFDVVDDMMQVTDKQSFTVSTLLGALTAKDKLPQGQANSLIASAVTARVKSGAIRRSAERRLIEDMQTAMAQQMEASRESEVQAQQVRQTNAAQLADLHRHQAPSKKTSQVAGADGRTLRIKVKQYGGSAPTAPPSSSRVSWEL